jgi:transposase-like protein
MRKGKRQFSEQFKFKVALEAAKGLQTINEIASAYDVHPNQVSSWKKRLLEEGAEVFRGKRRCDQQRQAEQEAALYEQIGRLKMELEWLKKKVEPFS